MSAEIPSSNNFSREPDVHRMSPEEIKRNFAGDKEMIESRLEKTGTSLPERKENEPYYIDKLIQTPLPLDKMSELLAKIAGEYTEDDGSQISLFNRSFIGSMQMALQGAMENHKDGDCITFDELRLQAEIVTGHDKLNNPDSIINDRAFVDETNAVERITDKFAVFFERSPDLKYIGDDIDTYTVHADVHTYQRDRIKNNPGGDFMGLEHGQDGRWIPEERGGLTIWTSKAQSQPTSSDTGIISEPISNQVAKPSVMSPAENAPIQESGLPDPALLAKIPDDKRARMIFARENFTGKFDINKTPLLVAFLAKDLVAIAKDVPTGSRYPDTIAGVIGDGGYVWQYLRAILVTKQGRMIEPGDFSRLPFSAVAKELGMDVVKLVPDYQLRFRMAQ